MDVRVCCLLLFVAASWVPSLAYDFVIRPRHGELTVLHKRGQNASREDTITPKLGIQPVDSSHEGTIKLKQGGNPLAPKLLEIFGKPRQDGDPVECQGTKTVIVGNEGIRITSPNYPNNYPNSEDCVVTINAVTNECKLEINCDDFQIQDSENCRKDFLLIREDRLTKEKFCGNEEFVYMSNKETLKLRFRSNRQITDKGFSCFVRSVCPTCNIGSCQCGVVNSARIVGGEEVDPPNNYPWHVGIKFLGNSNYWCGGSIINDQYVLTAAHCVDDITSIEGLVVGVADHNMASTDEDIPDVTRLVAVQEIIVHPDYNSATIDSDIALLRLSETLDVYQGDQIRPVCLPADDSSTYAGEMATATGWGTLESGGSQSSVLQEVTMPILEPSCPGMPSSYITENMLCAGLEEGGKDTCQGDSGGPLVQNYFSKYVQVGITSWGFGCADAGSPGVYTRVSKFLDWICANTADATYCQ
ncbi:serine protease 30-like [Portunus trituberculatus]|uniref:serine protease 30-like n=1 Tax=Portunus trituberculatus TaxID=210409 RepID=UPI001E1CEF71|nr:serine protease 30-like [Portunus trituberculatus]